MFFYSPPPPSSSFTPTAPNGSLRHLCSPSLLTIRFRRRIRTSRRQLGSQTRSFFLPRRLVRKPSLGPPFSHSTHHNSHRIKPFKRSNSNSLLPRGSFILLHYGYSRGSCPLPTSCTCLPSIQKSTHLCAQPQQALPTCSTSPSHVPWL